MGALSLRRENRDLARFERELKAELARHTGTMDVLTELTTQAVDEMSLIHGYVVYKTTITLVAAEKMQDAAAGYLTPTDAALLAQCRQLYLHRMNELADAADEQLVEVVRTAVR